MTEPLTPKSKHVNLEARVTALEGASGSGVSVDPPRLAARQGSAMSATIAPNRSTGTTNTVQSVVISATTRSQPTIIDTITVPLHLQGTALTVGITSSGGQMAAVAVRAAESVGTGVAPRTVIQIEPVLFGMLGEQLTVFTEAPVVGAFVTDLHPLSDVGAFLRDANGQQVSVAAQVRLDPAPSPLVEGPASARPFVTRYPARPEPVVTDGYVELLLPEPGSSDVPVLRLYYATKWFELPFMPAGGFGGGGGDGGVS